MESCAISVFGGGNSVKIPKSYLGKYVEVVWRDPGSGNVKSRVAEKADLPRGISALATWKERGVLDDITEGVLRIIHSVGYDPAYERESARTEDYICSWVPEALVEEITVYEPTSSDRGAAPNPMEGL